MTRFASITAPERVAAWLAPQLGRLLGEELPLRSCEVMHVWRRLHARADKAARAHAEFCYRLTLGESADAPRIEIFHGRARLPAAPAHASDAGSIELQHPGLLLSLRRFPDDPALPQLAALGGGQAHAQLPPAASGWLGYPAAVATQVVSYRPGTRCTLRYMGGDSHSATDASAPTVYAKTYAGALATQVADNLSRLAEGAVRNILPQSLDVDRRHQTLWFAGAEGASAAAHCANATLLPQIAMMARGLADLHRANPPLQQRTDRQRLLDESDRRIGKLHLAMPAHHMQLDGIRGTLRRDADTLPAQVPCVVHGDLHLRQWLLSGDRACLLDFDELTVGDAEQDLASLLIDIELTERSPSRVSELWAALLSAYQARAERAAHAGVLRWHLRLQRVARAYRCFWRSGDDARPIVASLVGAAATDCNTGIAT